MLIHIEIFRKTFPTISKRASLFYMGENRNQSCSGMYKDIVPIHRSYGHFLSSLKMKHIPSIELIFLRIPIWSFDHSSQSRTDFFKPKATF